MHEPVGALVVEEALSDSLAEGDTSEVGTVKELGVVAENLHEPPVRHALLHLLEQLHPREDVSGRGDYLPRRALSVLVGEGVDKSPQGVSRVEEPEEHGGFVSVVSVHPRAVVHAVRMQRVRFDRHRRAGETAAVPRKLRQRHPHGVVVPEGHDALRGAAAARARAPGLRRRLEASFEDGLQRGVEQRAERGGRGRRDGGRHEGRGKAGRSGVVVRVSSCEARLHLRRFAFPAFVCVTSVLALT